MGTRNRIRIKKLLKDKDLRKRKIVKITNLQQ